MDAPLRSMRTMWPNKKALKLRSWTAFIVSSCTNWEKFLRLLDCLPVRLWHVNKINIFQDIRARLSSLVEMRCWVLALTQGRLVDCFVCHCDYYPRHKPCAGSHWAWLALALGKLMWKTFQSKVSEGQRPAAAVEFSNSICRMNMLSCGKRKINIYTCCSIGKYFIHFMHKSTLINYVFFSVWSQTDCVYETNGKSKLVSRVY